ncbi:MAG: hypothetical protein WDN28_29320 [Chthoniobacter sp.]
MNMARTQDKLELFRKPGQLVEFAACGVDIEVLWSAEGPRR